MNVRLIGLAAACVLCAGCERPISGAAGSSVTRDSAGIQIVDNRAAVWKSGDEWRVDMTPTLRIGAPDGGEPAALFTDIDAVRRLSDGRIVVLDDQTRELRWFDQRGRHLFTRGGKGEGPGEFEATVDFLVLAGDTIMVIGAPFIRFVTFSPEGEYLAQSPLDVAKYATLARWQSCPRVVLRDRSVLGCFNNERYPVADVRPGYVRQFAQYGLVTPGVDSVIPLGAGSGIPQWIAEVGGRLQGAHHPFELPSRVAAGGKPLRIAIGLNPEYSIEIWSRSGELERIIRRIDGRQPASDAERRAAEEELRRVVKNEQAYNTFVSVMEVPESPAAIMDLWYSPSGFLWVSRASLDFSQPWTWDVFDPAGRFMGGVKVPAGLIVYEAGDDYLLGIRRDADDVEYVELYTLIKPGGIE